MALGENEGSEALYAPMLRPAPVDAALLIAVHRGLEAVPVLSSTTSPSATPTAAAIVAGRAEGSDGRAWQTSGVPTPAHGLTNPLEPAHQHGGLAHRRRP